MSEGLSPSAVPAVTAVVLAYGDEPLLEECVAALLASTGVQVSVVLVDNGCSSGEVERLVGRTGVEIVRPGDNTGFAGGCNLGARRAQGDTLVLVNSDALVAVEAVGALVAALSDPGVGIASGSLRLRDRPDVMNSVGNPMHFLGLSWAGGLGEAASAHQQAGPVASATGAIMAVRRGTWEALGGFYEPMFAYCEDLELSQRCWQRGWNVQFVPDAVCLHDYVFHRNPRKMYLLERNRLLVVLTLYEARTLRLLAAPLLGLEAAVLVVALRQGWGRQKLRGWWWLLRHRRLVLARRAEVQAQRGRTDRELAWLLTGSFSPGSEAGFAVPAWLDRASSVYWTVVRRRIS